jgi:hypothetical protein
MRFFNKSKPSIEVEVVSLDAKLRVGETKWDAVVYRRVDDGQIHCRPKVEFFAKFVLIAKSDTCLTSVNIGFSSKSTEKRFSL